MTNVRITRRSALLAACGAVVTVVGCSKDKGQSGSASGNKKKFTVGISIYDGWMPYYWADKAGTFKKWAERAGFEIEIIPFLDYMESVKAYTTGKLDALVVTNMDMLISPASSGLDSTVVVLGDTGNGSDKFLVRNGVGWNNIKGKKISLVVGSVSEYVLARGLAKHGMTLADVKVENISDSAIRSAWETRPEMEAVVTWNPMANELAKRTDTKALFDSSEIPGEVQDLLIARTEVLKANPKFGDVLAGAWYETMQVMKGAEADKAMEYMAATAGSELAAYKERLSQLKLYYDAREAVQYTSSPEIKDRNELVRNHCFERGLMEGVPKADHIGIAYPDGEVRGNPKNVRIRYSTEWMNKAAEGTLLK